MPAKKPIDLHTRHSTKAEKDARIASEAALAPSQELPTQAPARLKDHKEAAATWRRMVREWAQVEAKVATRLDMDVLVDYCILMEQLSELDLMRKTTYRMWLEIGAKHDQAVRRGKEAVDAFKAAQKNASESGVPMPEAGIGSLIEVDQWEEKAVELASKGLDAFEAVIKLDGRVDRKRDLLLKLRQALYLTPRSRAGVAPETKEKEAPPDEMDALIGNVTEFVNRSEDVQ